eukprot:SAG31_NODE_71_length_28115_cov_4.128105_10_plen_67_part_00
MSDRVVAAINGRTVADLFVNASSACGATMVCSGKGRVALVSGFNAAYFDNITIQSTLLTEPTVSLN